MAIKQEIIDELLKDYKNPEDLLGVVFKILCHSSKLYKKGMTYYDRNRIQL